MNRIEKRKIEVEAIKPLIQEMEKQMSFEEINNLLIKINEQEAFERGAKQSPGFEEEIISKLFEDVKTWGNGGEMEILYHEKTDRTLNFDVKKCPYHELYKSLGMQHYGVAFSCCRDEAFASGFHNKLKLKRTKTLMEGHDVCDFRYYMED